MALKKKKTKLNGINAWRTVALAALLLVLFCSGARGAQFRVSVDSGGVSSIGATAVIEIMLIPSKGEEIFGGNCSINVDPAFIELSANREDYAADPALALVERFSVEPARGIVTFKARSEEPLDGKIIFLKIPYRFSTQGVSFVSFTSTVYGADNTKTPSNPGYFRLTGMDAGEMDPLLYASIAGENVLLTTGSLENSYQINPQEMDERFAKSTQTAQLGHATATPDLTADLGLSKLQETDSDEKAAVVVEFSKRSAKIGLNQWVRLDIMIKKFPSYDIITGVEMKVKYDPRYLSYTNNQGVETKQLDIIKRLEDMKLTELVTMANGFGIKERYVTPLTDQTGMTDEEKGEQKKKDEELKKNFLIEKIRPYVGPQDATVFSAPLTNEIDNVKGEIDLAMTTDWTANPTDMKYPLKVITLIFKAKAVGADIPVTLNNVLVPISDPDGLMVVRDAKITVDPKVDSCDQSLPATLCQGSFSMTGTMSFDIIKKRTFRKDDTNHSFDPSLPENTTTNSKTLKTPVTYTINKYILNQNWNVFLGGAFRNGMRVNGNMSKNQSQGQSTPMHVDISLLGGNAKARMGDFSTDFKGSELVSLPLKEITGLQLDYLLTDKIKFTSLLADSRSTTKELLITVNASSGPYTLPKTMIPGTAILYDKNGLVVSPDKIVLDYYEGTLNFKDLVTSGDQYTLKYEESAFIFSTGQLKALGLSYDSIGRGGGKSKIKLNSSLIMSSSPKSAQKPTIQTKETYNLNSDTTCEVIAKYSSPQFGSGHTCQVIDLHKEYVVPNSIQIVMTGNKTIYTPEKNSGVIYVPSRGYRWGIIVLDRSTFKGTVEVSFSYYNDGMIRKNGALLFTVDQIRSYFYRTNENVWPSDIIAGSERIYASDDDSDTMTERTNGRDQSICYEEDNNIDLYSSNLCPDQRSFYTLGSYGLNKYFDFNINTFPETKKYIKIFYDKAPPDFTGGSEYSKTALGIDGEINPAKNLSFNVKYARTNSDLSSSFDSESTDIVLDIPTVIEGASDTIKGKTCEYSSTDKKLSCYLRPYISGPVTILFTNCNSYNTTTYTCLEYDQTPVSLYESTDITIDREKGLVIFRKVNNQLNGSVDFPSIGDKIALSYVYDRKIGRLVQGSKYSVSSNYNNKFFTLTMEKTSSDPYFDTSLSGRVDKTNTTGQSDYLSTDIKLKPIRKWSLSFRKDGTITKRLTDERVSSIDNPANTSYTISYGGQGRITALSMTRTLNDTNKRDKIGSTAETVTGSTNTNTVYNFGYLLRRPDIMKMGFQMNVSDNSDKTNPASDNYSNGKSLTFDYRPKSTLSLNTRFDRSFKNPTGEQSRTNNYGLSYKPFKFISTDIKFNRTNNKPGEKQPSKITEQTTYSFTTADFFKFSGITYSITSNKTPTNEQQNGTKDENRTLNFTTKIRKNLIWTPSFTRTSNFNLASTLSKKIGWQLRYTPGSRKIIPTVTWSKDISIQSSPPTSTGAINTSKTINNTYTFNSAFSITHSSRITSSLTIGKPGSGDSTRDFNLTHTFQVNPKTSLSSTLRQNRKSGVSAVTSTYFDLGANTAVTTTSNLKLTYSKKLYKSNSQINDSSLNGNDFTANLSSTF